MEDKIPTFKEHAVKYVQRADTLRLAKDKLMVDWSKVFVLFPRYCHILLIAPHHTSPDLSLIHI